MMIILKTVRKKKSRLVTQSRRYVNGRSVKASVVFAGESVSRCTVNPPVSPLSARC